MYTFNRNMDVDVEEMDQNLMKVTAFMQNKLVAGSYSENFKIVAVISDGDFEIKDIPYAEITGLSPYCYNVIPKLKNLTGIKIGPDYNKKIIELLGGEEGCTHIVELLGEIGRCIHQAHYFNSLNTEGLDAYIEKYMQNSKVSCLGLTKYCSKSADNQII